MNAELLRLAAATLVGGILYVAWPWMAPADDLFRSTIAVVPAVAAALGWLGRDAARRSGRSPWRASWLEWALLLATLFSLPFRHGLGWSMDDGPWAAALALALGAAVRRRLLDLRPLLGNGGGAASRAVPIQFFLLPLIVYSAIQPWALATRPPDGDEPYNLLLAHSLAFDLDTDLRNQYEDGDSLRFMDRRLEPQAGDPVARDGSQQSRHSALLPAVIAIPYLVAGRVGAATLMALLSAALAWQCLRLARRVYRAPGSTETGPFLAWAVLAFLPPLLLYAHQIWVEVPAALVVALALDLILGAQPEKSHTRLQRRRDLLLAALLAILPLLKLRFLFLSVGLLLVALGRFRHGDRRLVRLALPGVAVTAALTGLWWWRYGNPLKLYTRGELSTLTGPPWHYIRGFLGLFYDCAFGLFATAPLWALLLPGIFWLMRSPAGRRLAGGLALCSLPYLLAVVPRLEWYGGWSPPFRYAVALLPVLMLLLSKALSERRLDGLRLLVVLLGVPTLLLTLLWVVSPPWTYNLADGYSDLLQLAGGLLAADVGRFFPSLVRPRIATWIWIAASLVLVPVAGLASARAQTRRWAGTVGFCLLLAFFTLLPLLTHRVPTGRVEVEDQWVEKRGGVRHPGPWRQRRPEAAGGWLIGRGHQMVVRAVPGGPRVRAEIRLMRFGLGADTLHADLLLPDGRRQTVGSWKASEEGEWRNLDLGPVDWPAGASLVLYHPGRYRETQAGLVVDWIDFRWLASEG